METNKVTGIDSLSGHILKDESSVLATPIAQICNLSIKLSAVPGECRIINLKPFYKKGKKADPKNYKAISLLPVISKILERVIDDQKKIKYTNFNQVFENFILDSRTYKTRQQRDFIQVY